MNVHAQKKGLPSATWRELWAELHDSVGISYSPILPVNNNTYTYSIHIQWSLSNADTNGVEESVLYREVSSVQGLKRMQEWYLGRQKVSLLERCPQFRGVLIEGFHCILYVWYTYVCINVYIYYKMCTILSRIINLSL